MLLDMYYIVNKKIGNGNTHKSKYFFTLHTPLIFI